MKAFRKIDRKHALDRVTEAIGTFQEDPRHPSLNCEKLKGRDDRFTIRANLSICVLFRLEVDGDGEVYVAIDVGGHDKIYR